jgi:uncharacterized protein
MTRSTQALSGHPSMPADHGLARLVSSVAATDSHAHPLALGEEPAGDPSSPVQPYDYPLPLRMRQTNREYHDAWAALWGYEHGDREVAHLADLMERKLAVCEREGSRYNSWVLDQCNVETMIAIASGPEPTTPAPRFRWCAPSDWCMWPFPSQPDPAPEASARFSDDLALACQDAGLDELPRSLDEYVIGVVEPALDARLTAGAVGLKFVTPYYRSLAFGAVSYADADARYRRGVREGSLPPDDHRVLEDYLFRAVVQWAGGHDLPVQMHTGLGLKPHFDVAGSNPLLMERIFADCPSTRFQLLHGGWPFSRETISLLSHDNVYIDFSCASIYFYPRALSDMIRPVLEWFPEKLLYGTDAYSDVGIAILAGLPVRPNPLTGWEEKLWLIDRTWRHGLSMALSGMFDDGEISATDAESLVAMVLHETAERLYDLKGTATSV